MLLYVIKNSVHPRFDEGLGPIFSVVTLFIEFLFFFHSHPSGSHLFTGYNQACPCIGYIDVVSTQLCIGE